MPDKSHGTGNDTLILRIAENIDNKERKFSIGIGNITVSRIIQITQQAAAEEHHYKLPVIFYILYDDPSAPQQNVDADVIAKAVEEVNAYYRNTVNSVDMNLEFVLATQDPEGNLLQEPGIERVYLDIPSKMSYNDFLKQEIHCLFCWNSNKYINVITFPFTEKNILGASTLPFTIGSDPLDGLQNGDDFVANPTLVGNQCVVLNNNYILTEHQLLKVPDVVLTLTHEFGHYFGLFHVFEEDYCDDTETYDREAYEKSLSDEVLYQNFESVVKRTSYTGSTFVSYYIMDYDYSYLNQFTQDQRKRVRHVLEKSPLIPGPKHTDYYRTRSTRSTEIPQQRFIH